MKPERRSQRMRGGDAMPGPLVSEREPGGRGRSRWLVLGVLCAGMLMVVLGATRATRSRRP